MDKLRIFMFLRLAIILSLFIFSPGCGGGDDSDDNTGDDNNDVTGQCATPTFSPAAGAYTSDQTLTISTTTSGATIYYTTDGTDPSTDSTVYSSAISVSGDGTSVIIKAIAVASGMTDSEIASGTFTIDYEDTTPDPPDISSITIPADSEYDTAVTDTAEDNAEVQMEFGTSGTDKIAQYAGTITTTQYAEGSEGNDWILQVGGDLTTSQQVVPGEGDDTVYQYGGTGNITMTITGATGNQTFVQVGGDGNDTMNMMGYAGSCVFEQYGVAGNNTMDTTGSSGDDTIEMYGGTDVDTMTYNLSDGADEVTINGGADDDTLTINLGSHSITLEDTDSNVLYQYGSGDTTVTVSNVEDITVNDSNGDPVYESN